MSITSSELKFYKSSVVNDTTANGGIMSSNQVTDAVKNNVWPDIPEAERTAGSTKYRKVFAKVANDDDITLVNPSIFVETQTPGDDRILIFSGTNTDTQNDITGSERLYGAGQLDVTVSAGVNTFDVNTEAAADDIFQDGDLVRISSKDGVNAVTGDTEEVRLANPGGVSWSGDKATLTLDTGVTLANGYTNTETRVASVIEASDIIGSWDNWSGSTTAGTYDGSDPGVTPPTTEVPVLDSIGTVEETWTITFTDATNFGCVGSVVGSVGTGSIGGGDFAPNNGDFTKPYFTLPDAGWGGTWAGTETLTFQTHPAAAPIWQKRIVPAAASSLSANKTVIGIKGESA